MTTDEEKSGLGAADLNATASTYVPDRNPEEAVGGIPDGEVEGRDRVDKLKKDYGVGASIINIEVPPKYI